MTGYLERLAKSGGSNAAFDDTDLANAIASLFKQMVLADGIIKEEEVATSVRQLVGKYGYLQTGNDETITERFGSADSESLFSIAAVINKSMTVEQRKQLLVQLVSIAMSDREFHPYEQDFMQLVEKLIKT